MPPPEFKATNMVMVSILDTNLTLPSIYELLTLVHVKYTIGMRHGGGSRVKIPYFGVEGAIVSVRFGMKSRGIRNEGGQLRNVVSIDLQFAGKNIHLKISEHKILLAGALTQEMGNCAFQLTINHIEMVQGHWTHIKSLPIEMRDASIKWLCDVVRGDEDTANIEGKDHKVNKTKDMQDPKMIETLSKIPENLDARCIKYLSTFVSEYKYHHEFIGKLVNIFSLETPIYTSLPRSISSTIVNSIYNYRVGERVSLIKLVSGLNNKGYAVLYHNWNSSKSIQVMRPVRNFELVRSDSNPDLNASLSSLSSEGSGSSDSEMTPRSGSSSKVSSSLSSLESEGSNEGGENKDDFARVVKGKLSKVVAHRCTIYQSGAIRQSSPTIHKYAEIMKNQLLQDINEIIKGDSPPLKVETEVEKPLDSTL